MKKLLLIAALLFSAPAYGQIISSGAQRVQGAGAADRGDPVNVRITDGSGAIASSLQVQGTTAEAVAPTANPIMSGGVYTSSAPTLTNGQGGRARLSVRSNFQVELIGGNGGAAPATTQYSVSDGIAAGQQQLAVAAAGLVFNGTTLDRLRGNTTGLFTLPQTSSLSTHGAPPAATTAAAGSLVLKASAGNLYNINVTAGASAGYVLLFNATSAPSDGAVTPVRCIPLAANAGLDISYPAPLYFSTGITAVFSTTGCFTQTASATAFISGSVR